MTPIHFERKSRKQLEICYVATIANRYSAVRQYGRLS